MNKLLLLFRENHVDYLLYEHEPVYTSEQASKVRGVELKTGVKALLVRKVKEQQFFLADIAADRKMDFRKLEKLAGSRKIRFGTRDEVISVTKCEPGSVHPFGKLFGIETYLDESVLQNEFANFNIGLLTRSVRIRVDDLIRVLKPTMIGNFAKA